jgi:hypothetical protein
MAEADTFNVRQQVIKDRVSGLTFQFEVTPGGESVLHVFGDGLPNGNRTFEFDREGDIAGRGTCVAGRCRPSVLVDVDAL